MFYTGTAEVEILAAPAPFGAADSGAGGSGAPLPTLTHTTPTAAVVVEHRYAGSVRLSVAGGAGRHRGAAQLLHGAIHTDEGGVWAIEHEESKYDGGRDDVDEHAVYVTHADAIERVDANYDSCSKHGHDGGSEGGSHGNDHDDSEQHPHGENASQPSTNMRRGRRAGAAEGQ